MTRHLSLGDRLRKLLLDNPLGLSVPQMSKLDGTPMDTIMGALYRNYGFYIGGWQKADTGKYRALWCVVRVPMSAPRPVEYAECLDTKEAIKQRKMAEFKVRQHEQRELRKKANEQLRAQREIEKLAAKQRKAEAKLLRQKMREEESAARKAKAAVVAWQPPIEDDGDTTTIRTRWVTPPPWMQGART